MRQWGEGGSAYSLQFVPGWFVTQQQLKIWHDDDDYCNELIDELIEWYEGHKGRKAQKSRIKKELMPIAWHPSRYWDWCMSEDKKTRDRKIVGINMGLFWRLMMTRYKKSFKRSIKLDPH